MHLGIYKPQSRNINLSRSNNDQEMPHTSHLYYLLIIKNIPQPDQPQQNVKKYNTEL